jgi:hypothetical protein
MQIPDCSNLQQAYNGLQEALKSSERANEFAQNAIAGLKFLAGVCLILGLSIGFLPGYFVGLAYRRCPQCRSVVSVKATVCPKCRSDLSGKAGAAAAG